MNTQPSIRPTIVFCIITAFLLFNTASGFSKDRPRVSKADARKAVLAAVPKGKILSTELETEQGSQVWSFDVRDGKSVRELWVDASTGTVTHNEIETKAAEVAEKKMDKAEAMVKHKTHGTVTSRTTEGTGADQIYVFQVKKKDGSTESVRVNAATMKIVK